MDGKGQDAGAFHIVDLHGDVVGKEQPRHYKNKRYSNINS